MGSTDANDSSPDPTDPFLVQRLLRGDAAALEQLMARYDRLVRFAIFRAAHDRCRKDPQWLDSMASVTWTGFIQSMRRSQGNGPHAIKAFLVRIARNQVISELRKASAGPIATGFEACTEKEVEATQEGPAALAERLEMIEAMRACLAELEAPDHGLASQLQAISERRWKDAAAALELPESTVRSRWKGLIQRLRTCVEGKTGQSLKHSAESFAPARVSRDS